MSQILHTLKKKIVKVKTLRDVVKMMKNFSASRILSCKQAVESMKSYHQVVQLGFHACLSTSKGVEMDLGRLRNASTRTGVIIFGSDRGMVGQFNEIILTSAFTKMEEIPEEVVLWGIGDKLCEDCKLRISKQFHEISLPNRIEGIIDFVKELAASFEEEEKNQPVGELFIFYNQLVSEVTYQPVSVKVLPLELQLNDSGWPTSQVPEVIGGEVEAFLQLIKEYLFVSFYKACAESMASENASRLSMMQEAEQNIHKLIDTLEKSYFEERQITIDEELFDVISGFETILKEESMQKQRSE